MTVYELFFGSGDIYCAWIQFLPLAISAVSGVANAISSSSANKAAMATERRKQSLQEAYINKQLHTPETERSENRAILANLRDNLKDYQKRIEGSAAITGATPGYSLAMQDRANRQYSTAARSMAANASKRRDAAEQAELKLALNKEDTANAAVQHNRQQWQLWANNLNNMASSIDWGELAKQPQVKSKPPKSSVARGFEEMAGELPQYA